MKTTAVGTLMQEPNLLILAGAKPSADIKAYLYRKFIGLGGQVGVEDIDGAVIFEGFTYAEFIGNLLPERLKENAESTEEALVNAAIGEAYRRIREYNITSKDDFDALHLKIWTTYERIGLEIHRQIEQNGYSDTLVTRVIDVGTRIAYGKDKTERLTKRADQIRLKRYRVWMKEELNKLAKDIEELEAYIEQLKEELGNPLLMKDEVTGMPYYMTLITFLEDSERKLAKYQYSLETEFGTRRTSPAQFSFRKTFFQFGLKSLFAFMTAVAIIIGYALHHGPWEVRRGIWHIVIEVVKDIPYNEDMLDHAHEQLAKAISDKIDESYIEGLDPAKSDKTQVKHVVNKEGIPTETIYELIDDPITPQPEESATDRTSPITAEEIERVVDKLFDRIAGIVESSGYVINADGEKVGQGRAFERLSRKIFKEELEAFMRDSAFGNAEFDFEEFENEGFSIDVFYEQCFQDRESAKLALSRLVQLAGKYNALIEEVNKRIENLGINNVRFTNILFEASESKDPLRYILGQPLDNMKLGLNIAHLFDEEYDQLHGIEAVAHEAGHGLVSVMHNTGSRSDYYDELAADWAMYRLLYEDEKEGFIRNQIIGRTMLYGDDITTNEASYLLAFAYALGMPESNPDVQKLVKHTSEDLTSEYSAYYEGLDWSYAHEQPGRTSPAEAASLEEAVEELERGIMDDLGIREIPKIQFDGVIPAAKGQVDGAIPVVEGEVNVLKLTGLPLLGFVNRDARFDEAIEGFENLAANLADYIREQILEHHYYDVDTKLIAGYLRDLIMSSFSKGNVFDHRAPIYVRWDVYSDAFGSNNLRLTTLDLALRDRNNLSLRHGILPFLKQAISRNMQNRRMWAWSGFPGYDVESFGYIRGNRRYVELTGQLQDTERRSMWVFLGEHYGARTEMCRVMMEYHSKWLEDNKEIISNIIHDGLSEWTYGDTKTMIIHNGINKYSGLEDAFQGRDLLEDNRDNPSDIEKARRRFVNSYIAMEAAFANKGAVTELVKTLMQGRIPSEDKMAYAYERIEFEKQAYEIIVHDRIAEELKAACKYYDEWWDGFGEYILNLRGTDPENPHDRQALMGYGNNLSRLYEFLTQEWKEGEDGVRLIDCINACISHAKAEGFGVKSEWEELGTHFGSLLSRIEERGREINQLLTGATAATSPADAVSTRTSPVEIGKFESSFMAYIDKNRKAGDEMGREIIKRTLERLLQYSGSARNLVSADIKVKGFFRLTNEDGFSVNVQIGKNPNNSYHFLFIKTEKRYEPGVYDWRILVGDTSIRRFGFKPHECSMGQYFAELRYDTELSKEENLETARLQTLLKGTIVNKIITNNASSYGMYAPLVFPDSGILFHAPAGTFKSMAIEEPLIFYLLDQFHPSLKTGNVHHVRMGEFDKRIAAVADKENGTVLLSADYDYTDKAILAHELAHVIYKQLKETNDPRLDKLENYIGRKDMQELKDRGYFEESYVEETFCDLLANITAFNTRYFEVYDITYEDIAIFVRLGFLPDYMYPEELHEKKGSITTDYYLDVYKHLAEEQGQEERTHQYGNALARKITFMYENNYRIKEAMENHGIAFAEEPIDKWSKEHEEEASVLFENIARDAKRIAANTSEADPTQIYKKWLELKNELAKVAAADVDRTSPMEFKDVFEALESITEKNADISPMDMIRYLSMFKENANPHILSNENVDILIRYTGMIEEGGEYVYEMYGQFSFPILNALVVEALTNILDFHPNIVSRENRHKILKVLKAYYNRTDSLYTEMKAMYGEEDKARVEELDKRFAADTLSTDRDSTSPMEKTEDRKLEGIKGIEQPQPMHFDHTSPVTMPTTMSMRRTSPAIGMPELEMGPIKKLERIRENYAKRLSVEQPA